MNVIFNGISVSLLIYLNEVNVFIQVEHVVKEQNMLEALVLVEEYCYLLIEKMELLRTQKLVLSSESA